MKKNLKHVLFSLIFIIFCPILLTACDEETFDSIPYHGSSANAVEVINNFNNAGRHMITELGLKVELETTNVYTFHDSTKSNTEAKVVKDVISTKISNETTGVAVIKTTRYVDDEKQTELTNYYVKNSPSWFCYSNLNSFKEDSEIVTTKSRSPYGAPDHPMLNFFNSAIVTINPEEVASISEKTFEDEVYYRFGTGVTSLVEGVSGLETINYRFENDSKLFENPQLFRVMNKENKDAVEDFYYECSLDSSGYTKYFTISYKLTNINRETYLNVSSVTRLINIADGVQVSKPEDVNEFTANTFMKTMQDDASYITYYTMGQDENFDAYYAVVKVGENYSVRKEELDDQGAVNKKTTYFLVNNGEGEYISYEVREIQLEGGEKKKEVKEVNFNLDLLNFNFNLNFGSKNEEENSYEFTDNSVYTKITFDEETVDVIETSTGTNIIKLFVHNRYGYVYIDGEGNYYIESTKFITSIEDYDVVKEFTSVE